MSHNVCVTMRVRSLNQYSETQKRGLVSSCPTRVFKFDEDAETVVVDNPSECIFCKECIYTLEDYRVRPEDSLAVEVKHSADRFVLTVETTGALLAREVVLNALAELSEKIRRIQGAIPSALKEGEA